MEKKHRIYALWGFRFRVERLSSGNWVAMGRAPGKSPYPLSKIGCEATEDCMQGKLDSWAEHNSAKWVNAPVAVDVQPKLAI